MTWAKQLSSFSLSILIGMAALQANCGGKRSAVKDFDAEDLSVDTDIKSGIRPQPDSQVAVIQTDYGDLVLELYPNIAPQMVERFKKLVQEGFYDGTTFLER
ncbi:MAG: peptidylprolyl isomerase [Pyrinomonadaceae bacterium]